jgi:hypothetical protein
MSVRKSGSFDETLSRQLAPLIVSPQALCRRSQRLEFHHDTDQVNHVTCKIVSESERKQVRSVNGGAADKWWKTRAGTMTEREVNNLKDAQTTVATRGNGAGVIRGEKAVVGHVENHNEESTSSSNIAVRTTMDVVGGKWKPLIIDALMPEALRYGALLRRIPGASRKVLTPTNCGSFKRSESYREPSLEKSGNVLNIL